MSRRDAFDARQIETAACAVVAACSALAWFIWAVLS